MSNPMIVPPDSHTLNFTCATPNCGAAMRRTPPEPSILNSRDVSVITYTHERGVNCPKCNAYYVIGIAQINAQVAWGIEKVERPTGLVLAPSLT